MVARLLYTLGLIFDTRGDDARAEPLLQRALLVQEIALGPDHPHVGHTLNRLAILSRKRGDFIMPNHFFNERWLFQSECWGRP